MKKIIKIILIIILAIAIIGGSVYIGYINGKKETTNQINNNNTPPDKPDGEPPEKPDGEEPGEPPGKPGEEQESVASSGVKEITGEEEITENLESTEANKSVILVKDGGNAKVSNVTINKSSGDATNMESSEFNGVNAGILVEKDSNLEINDSKIITNAKGSNAVFATGENSKIVLKNTEIMTKGSSGSRGLDATYGGTIEGDNLTITTNGASSATLATDRGEGTINVVNSNLTTNGKGSPIIYSTGNISITETKGVSNGSQMVVIEGKNSATVNSSNLVASGVGNRNNVDNSGIMIYQSMSGDADTGKGIFNVVDSSLEISSSSSVYKTAPMFFITNTDAEVNITNTKLRYGSNILASIVGTSEWGNTGNNGGNLVLNAKNQSLRGNIIIDNISTLEFNLVNSAYRGMINNSNIAKEVKLKIDSDSKIILTGDTYVTSLENEDITNSNIDFKTYKLYVNGEAIN